MRFLLSSKSQASSRHASLVPFPCEKHSRATGVMLLLRILPDHRNPNKESWFQLYSAEFCFHRCGQAISYLVNGNLNPRHSIKQSPDPGVRSSATAVRERSMLQLDKHRFQWDNRLCESGCFSVLHKDASICSALNRHLLHGWRPDDVNWKSISKPTQSDPEFTAACPCVNFGSCD